MTKAFVTIRHGATVTHVCDAAMARQWMALLDRATSISSASPLQTKHCSTPDPAGDFGGVNAIRAELNCVRNAAQNGRRQARATTVQRGSTHERCSTPDLAGECDGVNAISAKTNPLMEDAAQKVATLETEHCSTPDQAGELGSVNAISEDLNCVTEKSAQNVCRQARRGATRVQKGLKKPEITGDAPSLCEGNGSSTSACTDRMDASMVDTDFESQILQRMAVIESAIRVQITLGASHLQQVEMAPEAFGLTAASRAPLRRLRLNRNSALHGVPVSSKPSSAMSTGVPEANALKRSGVEDLVGSFLSGEDADELAQKAYRCHMKRLEVCQGRGKGRHKAALHGGRHTGYNGQGEPLICRTESGRRGN